MRPRNERRHVNFAPDADAKVRPKLRFERSERDRAAVFGFVGGVNGEPAGEGLVATLRQRSSDCLSEARDCEAEGDIGHRDVDDASGAVALPIAKLRQDSNHGPKRPAHVSELSPGCGGRSALGPEGREHPGARDVVDVVACAIFQGPVLAKPRKRKSPDGGFGRASTRARARDARGRPAEIVPARRRSWRASLSRARRPPASSNRRRHSACCDSAPEHRRSVTDQRWHVAEVVAAIHVFELVDPRSHVGQYQ